MAKLVKLFLIFGPVKGSIKVIKKYANPGQTIDESLMSTLCLPKIELVDKPEQPRFQTFLVTKEDGRVLYGSGLIVHDRHHEPPPYPGAGRYASYCYTIITDTPFIHATRSLLQLVWDKKCDDMIIKSIMNIPLPARRKCLRIVSPPLTSNSSNLVSNNHNNIIKSNSNKFDNSSSTENNTLNAQKLRQSSSDYQSQQGFKHQDAIDDIYLYRGMTDLPLLDYPLRELFAFINIDDFLLAYACILMEFRTLIISQDNYKLMMVGETLTSLLLPLKWCNVYVPILPPVYGATYLDAPTSYIMGINTQVTELPENLNHIQCRIYCDESRVVCDVDSLTLPLFLNDIKRDILRMTAEYNEAHLTKPFNYLDDLKFNRAIRILFIKTIRKNILVNYERYIVDVPEISSEIRQFDVVSYLSDQPEFMRSFLSKFLDTQLFASFIDENARRIQQSWLSIFDMDPEELSEHFSDNALELAFVTAQRIHLMDLRQDQHDIEIKTVPASPMKLRRRMPGLSAITSRLNFAKSTSKSTSVETSNYSNSPPIHLSITSSPPLHRNSVATISLKGHLALDPSFSPTKKPTSYQTHDNNNTGINYHNNDHSTSESAKNISQQIQQSQPIASGKIIELINEVKDLTKRILVEKMGDPVLDGPVTDKTRLANGSRGGANNTLIGSLCDLIERVWAHGAYTSLQDNSAFCPLWNHLLAFTRLNLLDAKPIRNQFPDGSHLDVLSPKSETNELDDALNEVGSRDGGRYSNRSSSGTRIGGGSSSSSGKSLAKQFGAFNLSWFRVNRFGKQIGSTSLDLINDLKTIHTLKDVKTDVGRARAFIRLSLEQKKLSKHLKTLLGDQSLLSSLYKPYAFVRCEDEREQFLMYLLTLNAVDLPCFTTTFVSVIENRRLNNSSGGGNNNTGASGYNNTYFSNNNNKALV